MARFAWMRRRGIWIPLVVVVLLILLVPRLVPGGAVRDVVAARLQAATGLPARIGAVQAWLLPSPRVELRDLQLGPGDAGPLTSLTVRRLSLELAFGPLLRRRVEVTSLALEAPRVVVRAPASVPPRPGGAAARPAGPPLRVNIRSLTISDGALSARRADGAPLCELGGLDESLSATLAPGGDLSLKGRTTLDTLRFHAPQGVLGEGLSLTWEKDLRWEAASKRLTIAASTLNLGDLPVDVSGTLAGLGAPAPQADLVLRGGPAQVASLVGFLPPFLAPRLAGVSSAGEITLAAKLNGPLGPPPTAGAPLPFSWELAFDLANGRVSAPSLPAPGSGIEVHLRAHDDTVELARFAAATPTSRLAVSGTVTSLLAAPQVALKIDADVDMKEALVL